MCIITSEGVRKKRRTEINRRHVLVCVSRVMSRKAEGNQAEKQQGKEKKRTDSRTEKRVSVLSECERRKERERGKLKEKRNADQKRPETARFVFSFG